MKFNYTIGALVLALAANAGAFGKEGGGGKGFVCRNADLSETVYLADTYDLARSGALDSLAPQEADSTVAAVAEIIEKTDPRRVFEHPLRPNHKVSLAWMLEFKYAALKWNVATFVPPLDDDHIANVPRGCVKVQLAAQNVATGMIDENFVLTQEMKWIERGFLGVHETLVSLRGEPGADTSPIRQSVAAYAAALESAIVSLPQVLKEYVGQISKPPTTPTEAAQRFYRLNNCFDAIRRMNAPQSGSEAKFLSDCRKAERVVDRIRNTKIPSLRRAPEFFNCMTTYSPSGERTARRFQLRRISGGGLPTWIPSADPAEIARRHSTYQIRWTDAGPSQSDQFELRAENLPAFQWIRPFGKFIISIRFPQGSLRLDDFNPRTRLFKGALGSTGVICDGGEPDFEIDDSI